MSRPSGFPRRPAFYLLAALSSLPIEASRTKAFLLRRLGATVGRGVRFGRGTFLLCRNYRETVLGDWTSLGDRTFIAVGALRTGEDARIDMRVTMRGRGKVSIGAGCYIGADVYFDVKCDVTVEDDAGVGPGTWVFTHSVWQSVLEGGPRVFAPVRICREAWIPACVFIMPGVTVGERAIIGARSVVLADVPPGVLAAGSPAKVLRTAEQRTAEAPTPEERWRLVGLMLDELGKLLVDYRVAEAPRISRKGDVEIRTYPSRGRRTWTLAFCPGRLTAEVFAQVPGADCWVAMEGIDAPTLARHPRSSWFDVRARVRSPHWDPFNALLHEVFRGSFGVRFRIARPG